MRRWCGPCQNFQPKQKQIAYVLRKAHIKIAHMDCDDNRDFCNQQAIEAYPTAYLYVTGQWHTNYALVLLFKITPISGS